MTKLLQILSRSLLLSAAIGMAFPVSAHADDPSGSSGSSEDSGGGAYVAIGAGVLIAGLLLWDALSGMDDGTVDEPGEAATVSTGIDWSAIQPVAGSTPGLIAVSATAPEVFEEASELVEELQRRSGYPVFGEPIELGGVVGQEAFALAKGFFGAGWLVMVAPETDSIRIDIYGPEGLLDSRGAAGTDIASAAGAVIGVLSASGY